jgi:hypothetical protein
MDVVHKIDKKLADVFKDLPALPKSSKELLAQIWPWLALVGGLMQLFAALAIWRLLSWTNRWEELGDFYSRTIGVDVGPSLMDKTAIYIGVAILLVDAVILLMAFSPLRARVRRGWDLLFLAALLNVAYSVVSIFIDGRGFGSFVFSLLGSAVGFYLLYQVKALYTGKTTTSSSAKPH